MSRLDEYELRYLVGIDQYRRRRRKSRFTEPQKGDNIDSSHSAQPTRLSAPSLIAHRTIQVTRVTRGSRSTVRSFLFDNKRFRIIPLYSSDSATRRLSSRFDPSNQGARTRWTSLRSSSANCPLILRQYSTTLVLRPLLFFPKPLTSPRSSPKPSQPRSSQAISTLLHLATDQSSSFPEHLVHPVDLPLFSRNKCSTTRPHSARSLHSFPRSTHLFNALYPFFRPHPRVDPFETSFSHESQPLSHLRFSRSSPLARNLPSRPLLALVSTLRISRSFNPVPDRRLGHSKLAYRIRPEFSRDFIPSRNE